MITNSVHYRFLWLYFPVIFPSGSTFLLLNDKHHWEPAVVLACQMKIPPSHTVVLAPTAEDTLRLLPSAATGGV